jgi:hypothetical protein
MPTDALMRIASLCVVLAIAETLLGIARTVWGVPRTGNYLSFGLGFLVIVPWLVWVLGSR